MRRCNDQLQMEAPMLSPEIRVLQPPPPSQMDRTPPPPSCQPHRNGSEPQNPQATATHTPMYKPQYKPMTWISTQYPVALPTGSLTYDPRYHHYGIPGHMPRISWGHATDIASTNLAM